MNPISIPILFHTDNSKSLSYEVLACNDFVNDEKWNGKSSATGAFMFGASFVDPDFKDQKCSGPMQKFSSPMAKST